MADRALGLIEVRGYLGAVVAADAALKAANVSLLNIETIKSGLNTVQLVGDVSAVRSAVDAAVDLVQGEPYYLASHVISRLDDQTNLLFSPKRHSGDAVQEEKQEVKEAETVTEAAVPKVTASPAAPVVSEAAETEKAAYSREDLQKLKVVELRSLAYREEGVSLSKKEIKFANKKALIDALVKAAGKE